MKTENQLISDFMEGFNYSPQTIHTGANIPFRQNAWYDYKDMKFATSWDWLMPVVEKISSAGYMVQMQIDPGFKEVAACMIAQRTKIISFKGGHLLEAAYKAVVEFIKWLNETVERETNPKI